MELTAGLFALVIIVGIWALWGIIATITAAVEEVKIAKYKSQRPKCALQVAQDEGLTVVDMNKEVK